MPDSKKEKQAGHSSGVNSVTNGLNRALDGYALSCGTLGALKRASSPGSRYAAPIYVDLDACVTHITPELDPTTVKIGSLYGTSDSSVLKLSKFVPTPSLRRLARHATANRVKQARNLGISDVPKGPGWGHMPAAAAALSRLKTLVRPPDSHLKARGTNRKNFERGFGEIMHGAGDRKLNISKTAPNVGTHAAVGAGGAGILGARLGAAIGQGSGATGKGALIGGAVGAAGGGLVGYLRARSKRKRMLNAGKVLKDYGLLTSDSAREMGPLLVDKIKYGSAEEEKKRRDATPGERAFMGATGGFGVGAAVGGIAAGPVAGAIGAAGGAAAGGTAAYLKAKYDQRRKRKAAETEKGAAQSFYTQKMAMGSFPSETGAPGGAASAAKTSAPPKAAPIPKTPPNTAAQPAARPPAVSPRPAAQSPTKRPVPAPAAQATAAPQPPAPAQKSLWSQIKAPFQPGGGAYNYANYLANPEHAKSVYSGKNSLPQSDTAQAYKKNFKATYDEGGAGQVVGDIYRNPIVQDSVRNAAKVPTSLAAAGAGGVGTAIGGAMKATGMPYADTVYDNSSELARSGMSDLGDATGFNGLDATRGGANAVDDQFEETTSRPGVTDATRTASKVSRGAGELAANGAVALGAGGSLASLREAVPSLNGASRLLGAADMAGGAVTGVGSANKGLAGLAKNL